MAFSTGSKMAIAYRNLLTLEHVAQIEVNDCNEIPGHPVESLLYSDDPSMDLLTDTPSSDPNIILELNSSKTIKALGIYHHNLFQYDAVRIDVGNSMTGPWTLMNEQSFPGGFPLDWHPDMLLRCTPAAGSFFKITFEHSTPTAFFLGGLALFEQVYEVGRNVLPDDGIVRPYFKPTLARRTAGQARHRSRGSRRPQAAMDLNFQRIDRTQMSYLAEILNLSGDQTLGIIGPEQSGEVFPTQGQGHFFGEIATYTPGASQGVDILDHRQNLTIHLEGVV